MPRAFIKTGGYISYPLAIRPVVVGEFEDSALLKVFGFRGVGLFPAACVISKEIEAQYHVRSIGKVPGVNERLYAVTVERRINNPAVAAICRAAETWFAAVE